MSHVHLNIAQNHYEKLNFREALKSGFFELQTSRLSYPSHTPH